ncbi:MAG: hypothetical protein HXX11_22530 [Desulfuromonadales bacterium]|nr:hypothetical protein [Desulfuromonadales bacterium]
MKKVAMPSLILIVILMLTYSAYGGRYDATNGNIYEKMAIFSLISFAVFSIFLVAFGGGKQRNNRSPGKPDLIQHGATYPLSITDLTNYPVYVWDYRSSFHKIVFRPDGVFLNSSSVSTDGLDPTVTAAGTWTLMPNCKVQVTLDSAGISIYTRISKDGSAALIKPESGPVEAWYFGSGGLANIQISIFGYSALVPATMKFTTDFVNGKTFYWATYPCMVVTISGEVTVNHETTHGVITFNENGLWEKSVNNKIGSMPDYTPSSTGVWSVDNGSGVLTMTVLGFTTTAQILTQESENNGILVSTTAGNRIWFSDSANAPDKLAAYISEAHRLVPEF